MGDSDWEYEYDPNETEDFFFTIDISTHDPTATKGADRLATAQRRTSVPSQQHNNDQDQPSTPADNPNPSLPAGQLQILDLHAPQPFIKLDNDVYSCEWIDDLGTQIFVAEPGTVDEPAKSGNKVDYIGLSQSRLLARPIQIRHNPAYRRSNTEAIVIDDDDDDDDATPQQDLRPGLLRIPNGMMDTEQQQKQGSFLQRLSQIKADRKQSPTVFASEVRHYQQPENREQIKQKALEALAAQRAEEKAQAEAEKKARPRKRKRYTHGGIGSAQDAKEADEDGPSKANGQNGAANGSKQQDSGRNG